MIVAVFVGVWCRSTREHKTWWFKKPVHCYFCTLHRMCPYYLYRCSNVLKLAHMLEGLLLEVMCKEELKRTITYDFMYISVVLVFFWTTLYYSFICQKIWKIQISIVFSTRFPVSAWGVLRESTIFSNVREINFKFIFPSMEKSHQLRINFQLHFKGFLLSHMTFS